MKKDIVDLTIEALKKPKPIEYKMETRACLNCARNYRVLETSQQKYCGLQCQNLKSGTAVLGDPRRPSSAKKPPTAFAKSNYTPPKKEERLHENESEESIEAILSEVENAADYIIEKTKTKKSNDESNGVRKTESVNKRDGMSGMQGTKNLTTKKNVLEETRESRVERLGEFQTNLEREGLGSMQLLRKSANLLMDSMEAIAKSNQRQDDEVDAAFGKNHYDTDLIIKCANALASTVQMQTNILKAFKGLK